jgi:hypothetical protein
MDFIPTHSEFYNSISENHYDLFLQTSEELQKMANKYGSYDFLSNTPEDNDRFSQLQSLQREALFISIVFQAFAIEAYTNLVATHLYKEEDFFGIFEQMNTLKKIRKIFSEKLNKDFDSQEAVKEKIKKLFDLRDSLVHFKSRKLDLEHIQENPMNYNPYEYISSLYEGVDEVMKSFPLLKGLVNSLIGYDIYNQMMDDLSNLMQWNIQEMMKKTFTSNSSNEII